MSKDSLLLQPIIDGYIKDAISEGYEIARTL